MSREEILNYVGKLCLKHKNKRYCESFVFPKLISIWKRYKNLLK